MMRPKSITFRLTLFFSTASTAVLLVVGYLIGTLVAAHFEELDLEELNNRLELVRHTLAKARTPTDMASVPRNLWDALVGHAGLSVAVLGPDRKMLFTLPYPVFPAALLESRPPEDSSMRARPVTWERDGQAYRGIVAAAVTGIAGQPPVTVLVAVNIEHHRIFMEAFHKRLWLPIAASIALITLLGWIAARRGLAPVREMADMTHGISANRLGDRVPPESVPTELVDLAIAFNDMLDRLEDSFRRLSDFSSDLAHELRTPLSNLMTATQVALSRSRSAEEYREILHSNLEEYDRLARMIADMLFLAKADHGLIVPNRENIDLATEVDQLIGFYEALAAEQGIRVSRIGAGSIAGDRLMIQRAISNLLSNAIRHTPRGGAIKVEISDLGNDGIRVAVENPGVAIPSEHLPRLFDRFYRVDSCRQHSGEGAGLGLAITKSIVEAHGGTISVAAEHDTVRFEISMGIGGAPARTVAKE